MQIEPTGREFSYCGLRLADPDGRLTPEQVRDFYARNRKIRILLQVCGNERRIFVTTFHREFVLVSSPRSEGGDRLKTAWRPRAEFER